VNVKILGLLEIPPRCNSLEAPKNINLKHSWEREGKIRKRRWGRRGGRGYIFVGRREEKGGEGRRREEKGEEGRRREEKGEEGRRREKKGGEGRRREGKIRKKRRKEGGTLLEGEGRRRED
jgi:hypothetical protein